MGENGIQKWVFYVPVIFFVLFFAVPMGEAGDLSATVHKSPYCGCCNGYIKHLRENGISIEAVDHEDMSPIKQKYGIHEHSASCHTTIIDGYVVEGHVPLDYVYALLEESPDIRGISLPGMPTGVPGMPGPRDEPLKVMTIADSPVEFTLD